MSSGYFVLYVAESVEPVEATFEADYPGALERFKGALTTLRKSRGLLAHTHSAAPVAQQAMLNAPSWSLGQQRVLAEMIEQYEKSIAQAFVRTIRAP